MCASFKSKIYYESLYIGFDFASLIRSDDFYFHYMSATFEFTIHYDDANTLLGKTTKFLSNLSEDVKSSEKGF